MVYFSKGRWRQRVVEGIAARKGRRRANGKLRWQLGGGRGVFHARLTTIHSQLLCDILAAHTQLRRPLVAELSSSTRGLTRFALFGPPAVRLLCVSFAYHTEQTTLHRLTRNLCWITCFSTGHQKKQLRPPSCCASQTTRRGKNPNHQDRLLGRRAEDLRPGSSVMLSVASPLANAAERGAPRHRSSCKGFEI